MKKLLLSVFAIGLVSLVAFGATKAYFTDTETVMGNAIATGQFIITDTSDGWMTPVQLLNAKPGDSFRKWVKIKNEGTLDVGSLKVNVVSTTGDTDLLQHVNVSIYNTVDGYEQGIYTPDWGTGQPVTPWLNNINILGTAVYRDATAAHKMAPGKTATIILDFNLPTTLGNEIMGKSVTFGLSFEAEQVH